MANELPPDGFADHPPDGYEAGFSAPPDGFKDNPSALQKIAQLSSAPERYERAGLVGVERLFTGDAKGIGPRIQEAGERAEAAKQPDYKPQPGEKIGVKIAEYNDPRFIAMAASGAGLVNNPLAKAVVGGAIGTGGSQAAEDVAATGKFDPKKEAIASAEGGAVGAVFHGAEQGVSAALKASGNSFIQWMAKGVDQALPKEGDAGFSDTIKPPPPPTHAERVQGAIGDIISGKEKTPSIIDPKKLPPPPKEIVPVKDIKSDQQTEQWLARVQRQSSGLPTAMDIADTIHIPPSPEAIRSSIMDELSRGKDISTIASESALPKKIVQTAINMSDPINTKELAIQDAAQKGDPAAQLNVLQKAWTYWMSSPTQASSEASNLYRRRYEDINSGYLESHIFINQNTGKLNPLEKQALPFIIEGRIPDADKFRPLNENSDQILAIAREYLADPKDPNFKSLAQAHENIGKYMDEGHEFLKQKFDEIGYQDNYINHIWERNPKTNTYGPGRTSLSEKNPFSKARSIGSYAEGINDGHVPKTLDISELLKAYDNFKIKTVANAKFRDSLENVMVTGGRKAVLPASEAPPEYRYVDSNFFTGQRVSPEVYDAVNTIVGRPFGYAAPGARASMSEKVAYQGINGYEAINAVTKASRLSLGFMHYWNLTKVSMFGGVNPASVLKDQALNIWDHAEFDGIRDAPQALYKSFKEGHAVFANLPVAKDALDNGLLIGSIGDFQRGKFNQVIGSVEKGIKDYVGENPSKALGAVRTVKDIWDKALFDYFGSGIQLAMYENHVGENIEKFGDKMPVQAIKRSTADFVNKANGKAMESLMVSPKFRQVLHWGMLAPEWALTRLQTGASIFKAGPEGYQGRKFWLKSALASFTASQVMNYVNTAKDGLSGQFGPGRFTWENGKGDLDLHVYMKKNAQGRDQYTLLAKAEAEIMSFFLRPREFLGARASPNLQMMAEVLNGSRNTLTGMQIPKDQRGVGDFLKRNMAPFAMSTPSIGTVLPSSQGISKSQVIELYEQSLDEKDTDAFKKATKFGAENGYDVTMLQRIAARNVISRKKKALLAQ